MTIRDDQRDVVVMGAGPAGCACGIFLAQAGMRVTILESGRHPRHHVGESLLPASMPILERLGIGAAEMRRRFQPKYGARFYDPVGDRMAVFGFEGGNPEASPSFQVERGEFDALLAGRAREAGCELLEWTRAEAVDENLKRPVVRLADGRILQCDFVVDATGRGAMLARKHGTQRLIRDYGRVAIYNYFSGMKPHDGEDADFITMYLFEGGWVWLIPLRDGRTSVGVVSGTLPRVEERAHAGSKEEMFFWRAVRGTPRLAERMQGARVTDEYRANADFSYTVSEKFGERFVLVGDAAGFLDPIFSSGVHLGLASAERAAAAVIEKLRTGSDAGLALYGAYIDRGFHVFHTFVHRFYNSGLTENIFFMPNKPPAIHAALTRILAGHVWEEENPVLRLLGVAPNEAKAGT